ncbi:MAG TPA: transporter, partial [Kiritimatiellia bacterium]|nr:transporter [Kiritimatiellia bacterium]
AMPKGGLGFSGGVMKKLMHGLLVISFLFLTGSVFAEHYVNGVEGIKGGSVPPPGTYLRLYNAYYTADKMMDPSGSEADIGFDVEVMAVVPRLIWVSQKTVLGGNYAADIIVPFVSTDLQIDAAGLDDDQTGLGDIFIEPLVLAWHGDRYDAAVGAGVWLPTGDYDASEPASPGKDMYTTMLTLGGTVYADAARTWSASLLSRYEIHSEMDELDLTPGDDFHFEWGVAKTVGKYWDIGLAGYCQWQVTKDKGRDRQSNEKDQVYAAGPEVSVFIPKAMLFASLRALWEFEAEDRSEGQMAVLTLTKIF